MSQTDRTLCLTDFRLFEKACLILNNIACDNAANRDLLLSAGILSPLLGIYYVIMAFLFYFSTHFLQSHAGLPGARERLHFFADLNAEATI